MLGLLLGIVLTVVGASLVAVGAGRAAQLVGALAADTGERTAPLLLVMAGGLLLGLVAALRRLSPVVPLVGGLLLLAVGVLDWVDPASTRRVVDVLSFERVPDGADLLIAGGVPLAVGALLVVLALVPQGRRRPRREKGDDGRDDDGFTAVPTSTPQAWSPPQG
ncbi:hypothetical protein ASG41_17850 [Modestobacter sp. Leaf380]|nr:hypothetical protein ASG41_17850 [Modestobacter sp. Leaf380]